VVVDWDRGIWHPDEWLLPITPTDYGDIAEHVQSLSREFDVVEATQQVDQSGHVQVDAEL
jgi:hypothetical protein